MSEENQKIESFLRKQEELQNEYTKLNRSKEALDKTLEALKNQLRIAQSNWDYQVNPLLHLETKAAQDLRSLHLEMDQVLQSALFLDAEINYMYAEHLVHLRGQKDLSPETQRSLPPSLSQSLSRFGQLLTQYQKLKIQEKNTLWTKALEGSLGGSIQTLTTQILQLEESVAQALNERERVDTLFFDLLYEKDLQHLLRAEHQTDYYLVQVQSMKNILQEPATSWRNPSHLKALEYIWRTWLRVWTQRVSNKDVSLY